MVTIEKGCLICSQHEATLIGRKNDFEIVRCASCDLRQVSALPSSDELAEIYGEWPINEKYRRYARRKVFRWIYKLFKLRFMASGKDFLDVGCNVGFACEGARRLGFRATGIELGHDAVRMAKEQFPKCEFHNQTIQEFSVAGKQFDLVISSEVIEHLNDVTSFIDALAAVIKNGGLLYLTTPDGGVRRSDEEFIEWNEVCPPQHLLWFSEAQLKNEFNKRGFNFLYRINTRKPSLRLVFRKS